MWLKSSLLLIASVAICGCTNKPSETPNETWVLKGATIIDGTGAAPIEDGMLVVTNGTIAAIGPAASITPPANASVIDLKGKTIIPGIINAHGHIGQTSGLTANYSQENVLRDLNLNAAYGVTTVYSLGGDGMESAMIRNEQQGTAPGRSRIFIAGEVITGKTPEEARAMVDQNASMDVDFIKIRVDDNLGATEKMKPEIYAAVIDQAKKYDLDVVAHIFYLEDAKALLRLGVKFIAHSVRDRKVDEEFINLMKQNGAVYCPTLMREVSTFVYETTPDFFQDPFFYSHSDTSVLRQLRDPERQRAVKENVSTALYKNALNIARENLKILSDAGVRIAFGTDTGPPGRFQGYFEHLELELMVDSGLTPMQAIVSATRDAVRIPQSNKLGTLQSGKQADFIVLSANPLEDITNTRKIESVWIGGNKIAEN